MILRGRSRESDGTNRARPEEVLLQITLGFMVVLGYLLSDEVSMQEPLRECLRETVQQNALLGDRLAKTEQDYGKLREDHERLRDGVLERLRRAEQEYKALMATPKGELAKERDLALRVAQREKLLNAWLKLRAKHKLFQTVALLEHPKGLLSTAPPEGLSSHPLFEEFRDEVTRLFRTPGQAGGARALEAEIARCAQQAVAGAGFRMPDANALPRWIEDAPGWKDAADLADRADVRAMVASGKSVEALLGEIRTDFLGARQRSGAIQLRAVTRIAGAWAVGQVSPGPSASPQEVLLRLLDELDEKIGLLPDVKTALESVR